MKAIILTYAPVQESEQKTLKDTKIFKIAINQHAEEFNPDARIISDYVLSDIVKKYPEKIISIRESSRCPNNRIINPNIEFKGATIISALEYLIENKYNEILIIGDNKVNATNFQEIVNREIEKIKVNTEIYQYTNGNFNLPVKSITEFCE